MSWRDDLNYGLAAFGVQLPARVDIDALAGTLLEKPAAKTASVVGICSALFYIAERDHNPRVTSIHDALLYCSTCLSVGYAEVHPRTPVGKLIGSLLMMIGPSLSTQSLNSSADAQDAATQQTLIGTQQRIADTLEQILKQLQGNPQPRDER
jgi:hypothetical protein